MRIPALTLSLVFFLALPTTASAEIITFDFDESFNSNPDEPLVFGKAGSDLDNLSAGSTSVTVGGITLTLTASANSGVFNQTGTGFGINATGVGDDTDAFDSQNVFETMSFAITSNVALTDLTLVSFNFDRFSDTPNDAGSVTRNGFFLGPTSGIFRDADLSGSDVLSINESGILSTDTFVLGSFGTANGAGTTQGFGLEGITFDATAAAVPEPSAFGLLAAGFGFLFFRSRRRQQATTTT